MSDPRTDDTMQQANLSRPDHRPSNEGGSMRLSSRTGLRLLCLIGGWVFTTTTPSMAQGDGLGSSLGGYGAASTDAMPRAGGGPLIPYAGGFAGFMPYRVAGGGTMAFSARPGSRMSPTRGSFSLSS